MKGTPEWNTWCSMKARCSNPNDPYYHCYGGRGITVCKEWQNSFSAFYKDMGPRPTGKTLDRKDSDKGYNISNCKWSTPKEQARNRTNSRSLTYKGKTQCVSAWEEQLKISHTTILYRLKAGWSIDKTLSTPARKYIKKTK